MCIAKSMGRWEWPSMARWDEVVPWRRCRRKSKWKRRMTSDRDSKSQYRTRFRSLSEGQGGGEWWENEVFLVRIFREMGQKFPRVILWFSFPLAHTTQRSSCYLGEYTRHFSGIVRCSVARSNLLFKETSPANRFLSRKQIQLFIHSPEQSKHPWTITSQKRNPTGLGAEKDYWDDQGCSWGWAS